MGISPKTVAFLHALGHDAVHLSDQGLGRLPKKRIIVVADNKVEAETCYI